jgi:integral membrane protein
VTERSTPETPETPAAAATPATPKTPKRRFGGTVAQIRSALEFYKVLAYATGTMLLLLTTELVVRYGFHSVLMAGGTDAVTGGGHGFGFTAVGADGSFGVLGGVNVSTLVLIVHGWMYVVYLIADFRLWSLMRWPFRRFILIALGGVIPFLSFIVEGRIHKEVRNELAAYPKASKRY